MQEDRNVESSTLIRAKGQLDASTSLARTQRCSYFSYCEPLNHGKNTLANDPKQESITVRAKNLLRLVDIRVGNGVICN